jgi:hypothetical protein
MLLEEESPAYGDGSVLASSLGSACDDRASAQTLSPDSGSFQSFPREPAKVERASIFHGNRERQLRFSLAVLRHCRKRRLGIKQRRFAKASRNEGALSTVSARALERRVCIATATFSIKDFKPRSPLPSVDGPVNHLWDSASDSTDPKVVLPLHY